MKSISKVALAAALLSGAGAHRTPRPSGPRRRRTPPLLRSSSRAGGPDRHPGGEARGRGAQPGGAEPLVVQVEALVKNDDDRYVAAALRSDLEQQKIAAATGAGRAADRAQLITASTRCSAHPRPRPTTRPISPSTLGSSISTRSNIRRRSPTSPRRSSSARPSRTCPPTSSARRCCRAMRRAA